MIVAMGTVPASSGGAARPSPSLPDRFLGCLLGHAVGDALGAPFEGLPPDVIYYDYGSARRVVQNPPVETLVYTDDTQMTIALAESLLERRLVEPDALAAAFVANYDPDRGYGSGARRIIELMASGGDWRGLAETIFPGGSLGNGAAMRVAPVGLLFHDDLNLVQEQAVLSAMPTHRHPVGIDGAQLLALAVALVLRASAADAGGLNRDHFYGELIERSLTDEFRWQLDKAARLTADESAGLFGSSIRADRSVVTAIACFTLEPESYAGVVARAIQLGGDTDTVAAMAGALAGAHLGLTAVPAHLVERLENGEKGRDYIRRLATGLYERWATKVAAPRTG